MLSWISKSFPIAFGFFFLLVFHTAAQQKSAKRNPNIVLIYLDDLGY